MGAEPYEYTVAYNSDIQVALENLRTSVFQSGEYNGAQFNPSTPEEAMEFADADGTQSILDIFKISDSPDYGCAAPFTPDEMEEYFGTQLPSRTDVGDMFWDDLERGQARYIVLYESGEPKEIHFVGYSYD